MQVGVNRSRGGEFVFTVWAPFAGTMSLKVTGPGPGVYPMDKDSRGYWQTGLPDCAGARYFYQIDGKVERPDPASHSQPAGVHRESQVVDHGAFSWSDGSWRGRPLSEMVVYELHVGTFSEGGNFDGVRARLDDLQSLGINAVELMPVAAFPGDRNWGYDGVYPFCVHQAYGGPEGLKRLVDDCHHRGIAVILDVVYNHLGPEGNYFRDFGPYFTDKYKTPWGEAVNFDDQYSDDVRNYFIQNALHWLRHYHIDALRLDAVHAIYDFSAKPFLGELARAVEEYSGEQGREFLLIAESDLNDTRLIRSREEGGFRLSGQWSDDFHHAVHALVTGEDQGYYRDFGSLGDLRDALAKAFVYDGQYSPFRRRRHGNYAADIPPDRFVVCIQNHDQVGNRMLGERLSALVSFEQLKLAAAACLLSPYVPLIFMGEEYGEDAPFLYFVSHTDPELVQAVRRGRSEEFSSFQWRGEPPDPQAPETFEASKLDWSLRDKGGHRILLDWYGRLIELRRRHPALQALCRSGMEFHLNDEKRVLVVRREGRGRLLCFLNFQDKACTLEGLSFPGRWSKVLDSADKRWGGPGGDGEPGWRAPRAMNMEAYNCVVMEAER